MSREMKIQEDITRNQHRLTNHLVEQNKRYREAINNIIEKAMLFGTNEEVYDAIQDAIKALEGTE